MKRHASGRAVDGVERVTVVAMCAAERRRFGTVFALRDGLWQLSGVYGKDVGDDRAQAGPGPLTMVSPAVGRDYPGCPHCEPGVSVFQCGSCRRTSCWDRKSAIVRCAWCGRRGRIRQPIVDLPASEDL